MEQELKMVRARPLCQPLLPFQVGWDLLPPLFLVVRVVCMKVESRGWYG